MYAICFHDFTQTIDNIGRRLNVTMSIDFLFCFFSISDIEAQINELQAKKKELAQNSNDKGVGLLESGYFDSELYDDETDKRKRYEGYMTSIAANDEVDEDEEEEEEDMTLSNKRASYTAPKAVLKDIVQHVSARHGLRLWAYSHQYVDSFQGEKEDFDPFADRRRPTIAEKEDEYRQKRRRLVISPERADPFADGRFQFSPLSQVA